MLGLEGLKDLADLGGSEDLKGLVDRADLGGLKDLAHLADSGDLKDLVGRADSGDRADLLQDLKDLHQASTVAITRGLDTASEETLTNPHHPVHMAQDRDMVKHLILLARARAHHLVMDSHSRMVDTELPLLLLDMDNRPLVPREAILHRRALTDTLPLRHRGTR